MVRALYSRFLYWKSFPVLDLIRPKKRQFIERVTPYSMLHYQTLSHIYDLANSLAARKIPGQFVECGVCNGGLAGLIAAIALKDKNRSVWLFDSWEGLPEPKNIDIAVDNLQGKKGMALGSQEKTKELLFEKLKLIPERIHLIKGWFEETIPAYRTQIGPIAFMHLDGDWYDSIKLCLDTLFDQVVPGGIIVVDDYDYWLGCKKAVDEFLQQNTGRVSLKIVPFACTYIVKK